MLWLQTTPLTPAIPYITVSSGTGKSKQAVKSGGRGKEALPSLAPAQGDPSLPCTEDYLHRNGPTAGTLQTPEHLSHFSHSALAICSTSFHVNYFMFLLYTIDTLYFNFFFIFYFLRGEESKKNTVFKLQIPHGLLQCETYLLHVLFLSK